VALLSIINHQINNINLQIRTTGLVVFNKSWKQEQVIN
jgi:hypothetical protein